ncbi:hypothetical protein ISF_09020 [Cordyceps fumosorosea ARSEF 2679]|uniref:Uncharacterized protein n=1 Tax=Cordyceps fumosorosea (strain ARSEF 2679) TaxID=1081104 RepID=A0A167LGM5_CORFA|nr:hypothetical protein ISF_09020 [Cordyceps fumosorosea ARSEF 2679]OAA53066.1 hypothetical protein ISF_09020 [Cordyceps fumosorosea ARSEF 2679]
MLSSLTGTDAQRRFLETGFANARALADVGLVYAMENHRRGAELFKWLYGTESPELTRTSVTTFLRGISENATPVLGEPRGGSEPQNVDVVSLAPLVAPDGTGDAPQAEYLADTRTQVVYCTLDRLRLGAPGKSDAARVFDTATKEFLRLLRGPVDESELTDEEKAKLAEEQRKAEDDKAITECKINFAYSNTAGDPNHPDVLQMCPWFLTYAMQQHAQFAGQFDSSKMASMVNLLRLDKAVTKALLTPIDLFSLFDKVLVHECRKLSTTRGQKGAQRNADSVALFASAAGLIERGITVNIDGSLTLPDAAAPAAPADTTREKDWDPQALPPDFEKR